MKKSTILISLTLLLAVLAVLITFRAIAASTFLGSLTQVNSTTNTLASLTNAYFSMPGGTFTITHGGLTQGTNTLSVEQQVTFDGSTWFTIATWTSPLTNAGSYSWTPTYSQLSVGTRIRAITTSNIYVGGTYTY